MLLYLREFTFPSIEDEELFLNSMELKEALEGDRRWLWSIVGTAEMEN